jgi:death-on-curing protein
LALTSYTLPTTASWLSTAEAAGPRFGSDRIGLARPQNLAAYSEPDACSVAAAYAYGIAQNHGFVDGNKRTAWVIARLFLADNGCNLTFNQLEAIRIVEGVLLEALRNLL